MKWSATFTGRKVGAIGVFHKITAEVTARDLKGAALTLYDRYEHISGLKLRPMSCACGGFVFPETGEYVHADGCEDDETLQVEDRVKGAPGTLHEPAMGTVERVLNHGSVRVRWDAGGSLTGSPDIFVRLP